MSHRSAIGCAFLYDGSQAISIYTDSEPHAIIGLGAGSNNNGFTFQSSATGYFDDTEDNGSGLLRCTDTAHNLTTGQYITLINQSDAAHVGYTQVTVVDVNTFDCDDISHNSDSATGYWVRGSQLIVDPGYGGMYAIGFTVSATPAFTGVNVKLGLVKNITDETTVVCESSMGTSSEVTSFTSGIGHIIATGGDAFWISVINTVNVQDITLKHVNMHIKRM